MRVLFVLVALACWQCSPRSPQAEVGWEGSKAVLVSIGSDVCSRENLHVRVSPSTDNINMLGEWTEESGRFVFRPVVPFTRGQQYEVVCGDKIISTFQVAPSTEGNPKLLAIYPTRDTVPLNLLKVYFQFSQPMAESQSAKHIFLLHNTDTLWDTFLDLQPELWNEDGTRLTLWLDPGRIKRDLIPNRELGNPLVEGEKYKLIVAKGWKSREGMRLEETSEKLFTVGPRDATSPSMVSWAIQPPVANTTDTLNVVFAEAMDYSLAQLAIRVVFNGTSVVGTAFVTNGESQWKFVPDSVWQPGTYQLVAEGRLEDLCGNNLNRPFDRDVTKQKTTGEKAEFTREFIVDAVHTP